MENNSLSGDNSTDSISNFTGAPTVSSSPRDNRHHLFVLILDSRPSFYWAIFYRFTITLAVLITPSIILSTSS